jgi:predicted AAA+ superfamily ATPase
MLLESFKQELLALGVRKDQIIAINFEDLDFAPLCTAESLHAHVTQQLLGNKDMDRGFILENAVYLELVRRGFAVFVGKAGVAEIDFIAQKGDECAYYQVALTVRDAATLERELISLRQMRDHYPKYLLTLDDDPSVSYDGIQRLYVIDWLLA